MNKKDQLSIYFKNKTLPNLLTKYPSFYVCNKLNYIENKIDFFSTGSENLLYIHIPFCFSVCKFCNLYKVPYSDVKQTAQYMDTLIKELEIVSHKTQGKVSCIWIGGGTPNVLSDKDVSRLFAAIFELFNMEDNYHFELDIHPAFIRKTTLDIYKEYGVKLLSLGIQSFDENVIDISNRSIQNKVSLEKKLKELVPYNFNLHFDFIVGLPGDDLAPNHKEIDELFRWVPVHSISINKYENSFNTGFFKEGIRSSKEESHKKQQAVGELEIYIKEKYGIERIESIFIKHFFTNRYNVIATGAGAFGYIRGQGVYRNNLLPNYLSSKKIQFFSFDTEDERIMYILHNWDIRELSFLYKEHFGTYMYEDFLVFFADLDSSLYKHITDKHVYFIFPGNDFAAFSLIGLYFDKVGKYYD